MLIHTEMVHLHEDAAQGLAVLGKGTLQAVTKRLGDNLIVWPETFLRGNHCFQMVVQPIPLPISVYFIVLLSPWEKDFSSVQLFLYKNYKRQHHLHKLYSGGQRRGPWEKDFSSALIEILSD